MQQAESQLVYLLGITMILNSTYLVVSGGANNGAHAKVGRPRSPNKQVIRCTNDYYQNSGELTRALVTTAETPPISADHSFEAPAWPVENIIFHIVID
ncbi:hypothetical protein LguiB_032048 [Lonicera macranthoides]